MSAIRKSPLPGAQLEMGKEIEYVYDQVRPIVSFES